MNAPLITTRPQARTARLVGEPGVWLFVAGDMLLFGLFFTVYAYHYVQNAEAFQQAASRLSLSLGLLNTLLLLTSSRFLAAAVHSARDGHGPSARRCLRAAVTCGLGFVAVKAVEWSGRVLHGDTPMTNDFFMFYYMFTGIHLMHVLAGLCLLCFMLRVARRPVFDSGDIRAMEVGGIIWHLVDLLWIVLFSLFYLFGAP
ncbi:cytochrome c oxidase subunit 3 [Pseudomonas fluorescens]|nr:cytochrome c oxidase subunit 3 [Pseudomonas fluorescens]